MKYIKKIVFVFTVIFVLYGCSTKKDTLLSRNYHTLTTKYNVLFNGKEAFNEGLEGIRNGFKDNFFKQLPIEPIKFEKDRIVVQKYSGGLGNGFNTTKTEENKEATPFEVAEEKAVKAIQKHGMNIDGYERNRQIDDAYLLLGKSRYYSQRFIPAIEAFNYVIANYPSANLNAEAKIWRAKTNIRLDNERLAIELLNLVLVVRDSLESNLPAVTKEQAHTAMAMAYLKTDTLQKVKKHLILATRTLKNREQGARNLFILGQIYGEENQKDSARMVFSKLANFKKAPKKYKIHAEIEIAKNSSNDSSSIVALARMQELIKDRDNRPYLDELYYQAAVLNERKDSLQTAINYYNKSLRVQTGGAQQKSFSYEKLATLNFKKSEYQLANAYYDSVLTISTDTLNLRYRRIKRKYKNLASLIKFEEIVTKNDSIISLAELPKSEQEAFFENYIANLKKKDEEAAQLKLNQAAFGGDFGGRSLQSNRKGAWYFYNPQLISFGKTEFQKIWGNRKSEDNWRWASKIEFGTASIDSIQTTQKNIRYDLANYVSKIPTRKEAIDSLKVGRNQALYELGVIYKEQFKNQPLAIKRLERVILLNPKKELILPINWHLYQIYTSLNDDKARKHKDLILTKYSETVFAKIITNPDSIIKEESKVDEIEKRYKEIYFMYKKNKFKETVSKINLVMPTIQSSKLLPKFQLLKAFAIGKDKDKEAYKIAMEFVAVSYANTEEGKRAKNILEQLNKQH